MARISKGILGGFSGKVGTVVGFNWRGIDVMRSVPKKGNRIPTSKQAEVQAQFTLTAHFLNPIKPILSDYFGQPSAEKSRYNLAFSYHNREAIIGTYPDYEIDFPKVIVTKGELLGLDQPVVAALPNAELKFNWTDNSGSGEAKATDQLLVVVFNPARELFAYITQAANRVDASFTYNLPDQWVGDTVHCWVSMADDMGKKCANSVYLNSVVLT